MGPGGREKLLKKAIKWQTKPQLPSVLCFLCEHLRQVNSKNTVFSQLGRAAGRQRGSLGGQRLLLQLSRARKAVTAQLDIKHLSFSLYPHHLALGQKIPVQHLHTCGGKQ